MSKLLAKAMETITCKSRYFPVIEWSPASYTHNIFRCYEYLFGRRVGVRPEMSVSVYKKNGRVVTTYVCHSWEAVCALAEQYIRDVMKFRVRVPVRVWIPTLQTPQGLQFPTSPYLFAIALDDESAAGNVSTSTSPLTFSQTVSGSDRRMYVQAGQRNASTVSGVTYNTVSATQVGSTIAPPGGAGWGNSVWRLIAPDTGTNSVSIAYGGGADLRGSSISYTGCDQATTSDDYTNGTDSLSPFALTLTVPANGWTVGFIGMDSGTVVASTGSTYRTDNVGITSIFDSNGAQTGSYTMNWTFGGGETLCGHMVTFAPTGAAGPANLKSLDGNLKANIKSFDGNLIANIKSIDGNA